MNKKCIQVYTTLESITVSPFTGPFISIKIKRRRRKVVWTPLETHSFFVIIRIKGAIFLENYREVVKDNYSSGFPSFFFGNVSYIVPYTLMNKTTSIIEWGHFLTDLFFFFAEKKYAYKYVYIYCIYVLVSDGSDHTIV